MSAEQQGVKRKSRSHQGLDAIGLLQQLAFTSKKLKCQQELEEMKHRCCMCLDQVQLPLFLCKKSHFACAKCVTLKMYIPTVEWKSDSNTPSIKFVVSRIKCPVCDDPISIRYANLDVVQVLDNEVYDMCLFCNKSIIKPSRVGKHILTCSKICCRCPECNKIMPRDHLVSTHLIHECEQLACEVSGCTKRMSFQHYKQHVQNHTQMEQLRTSLLEYAKDPMHFVDTDKLPHLQKVWNQIQWL